MWSKKYDMHNLSWHLVWDVLSLANVPLVLLHRLQINSKYVHSFRYTRLYVCTPLIFLPPFYFLPFRRSPPFSKLIGIEPGKISRFDCRFWPAFCDGLTDANNIWPVYELPNKVKIGATRHQMSWTGLVGGTWWCVYCWTHPNKKSDGKDCYDGSTDG